MSRPLVSLRDGESEGCHPFGNPEVTVEGLAEAMTFLGQA